MNTAKTLDQYGDEAHHTEVRRVGQLKRAECSCGWVSVLHDVGRNPDVVCKDQRYGNHKEGRNDRP